MDLNTSSSSEPKALRRLNRLDLLQMTRQARDRFQRRIVRLVLAVRLLDRKQGKLVGRCERVDGEEKTRGSERSEGGDGAVVSESGGLDFRDGGGGRERKGEELDVASIL